MTSGHNFDKEDDPIPSYSLRVYMTFTKTTYMFISLVTVFKIIFSVFLQINHYMEKR